MTVAVAAPSALAAEAAASTISEGGNAVDAAITAAVASMVTEPGVVSPGAGAFVAVWKRGGDPVVFDGAMAVPGLAGLNPEPRREAVTMAYGGGITTVVGPASVAVPGGWAAFGAAHDEFGRTSWHTVMEPAVDLARRGTPLGPTSALYLEHAREPVFGRDHVGAAALAPDGVPIRPGDLVRVDGLTDSLERIAACGVEDVYRGELARALGHDIVARGGHLSVADLAAYLVVRREPLGIRLGGWRLATNPPPAVGGAALAVLLALAGSGSTAALVAAQRRVFEWRRRHADLAPKRALAIEELLRSLPPDPLRSPSTAHVSAAGSDGTVCAITLSAGYGSGVIPSGTGMWMNNGLGEMELVGDGSHLRPGDRINSNMTPTVGRHRDGRALAIGSPGADRITTAIAQTLIHLERGLDPAQAVLAPRIHVDVGDGVIVAHEPGIEPPEVGLPVRRYDSLHMYFGGVGLAITAADGSVEVVSDPRRNGATTIG